MLALLVLSGCRSGRLPDPNDPRDGIVEPETLQKQLAAVNVMLLQRVSRREITNGEYKRLMARAAEEIVAEANLDAIDTANAWRYAEVLRAAKRWEEAKRILEIAVKHAQITKNEDRRVNDTLRLAQAKAELGDPAGAITTARTTFGAPVNSTAPILFAVLYEIVPPARGKGKDLELARLLEDAAAIHMKTQVDPKSEAGQAFLATRAHHIREGTRLAATIYNEAGRSDLALEALRRGELLIGGYGRTNRV